VQGLSETGTWTHNYEVFNFHISLQTDLFSAQLVPMYREVTDALKLAPGWGFFFY